MNMDRPADHSPHHQGALPCLRSLYDDLRAYALGNELGNDSSSLALDLFLQRGMTGWMQAWTDTARPACNNAGNADSPIAEGGDLLQEKPSSGWHEQAVELLSDMIFPRLKTSSDFVLAN